MKVALLQMTSGIDPAGNAAALVGAITEAAANEAAMLSRPRWPG